jgi:hypothetical protein
MLGLADRAEEPHDLLAAQHLRQTAARPRAREVGDGPGRAEDAPVQELHRADGLVQLGPRRVAMLHEADEVGADPLVRGALGRLPEAVEEETRVPAIDLGRPGTVASEA